MTIGGPAHPVMGFPEKACTKKCLAHRTVVFAGLPLEPQRVGNRPCRSAPYRWTPGRPASQHCRGRHGCRNCPILTYPQPGCA